MSEYKTDFPLYMHHETVRMELNKAVKEGKISAKEATKAYFDWLRRRKEASLERENKV